MFIHIYNFEVTMGSYDRAEVCTLSSVFMLSLIGNKYNPTISDYTEMTDWEFLKIQAAGRNLNNLKRFFKKCLRTKA